MMTPEEQELMSTLCQQIAVEKDSKRFEELVCQLDELLERGREERRLKSDQTK